MQGVTYGEVSVHGEKCHYVVGIKDNVAQGLAGRIDSLKLIKAKDSQYLANFEHGKWVLKPVNSDVDSAVEQLIKRFEN